MKLATLVYVKQGGRTLMVHRTKKPGDYHHGKWNGLGGKLEPGESPDECMRRETLEESGLTVTGARMRGMITFPGFDGTNDWYCFLYTVHAFEGELIDSPEGRLEWIPDERLLELNLWPGDRVFLPWLSDERFFSAKFLYEDGVFRSYEVHWHG